MESIYIQILERLDLLGLEAHVRMSGFLATLYEMPDGSLDNIDFNSIEAIRFIIQTMEINGHVNLIHPLPITLSLTHSGLEFLERHRLTKSNIELNKSTLENNRIVSENVINQSKIFFFQSIVFAIGALFACLSFIVSCNTYFRDDKTKQLQSQLNQLKKDSTLIQAKVSRIKKNETNEKKDTLYLKMIK